MLLDIVFESIEKGDLCLDEKILVSKKEATKSDAVTIIKLAYEKLGNSYFISLE